MFPLRVFDNIKVVVDIYIQRERGKDVAFPRNAILATVYLK